MIRLEFSGEENARGSAPALTFEQAAEIIRTEPTNVRGSAPGLPLFSTATPTPQHNQNDRQTSLFPKRT
jgi:hypothetical protein